MGGWLDGSLGQWVGSGQITHYLINLDIMDLSNLIISAISNQQDQLLKEYLET